MSYLDRITLNPAARSGKPCIRGLRYHVRVWGDAGCLDDALDAIFGDILL